MKAISLLAVAILYLISCSCSDDIVSKPSLMIGNIESHQTVTDFLRDYPQAKQVLKRSEEGIFRTNELVELKIQSYRHNNVEGTLFVDFFNNKLMGVVLIPNSCRDLDTAAKEFDQNNENVIFISSIYHNGQCYASWSDRLLNEEFENFVD